MRIGFTAKLLIFFLTATILLGAVAIFLGAFHLPLSPSESTSAEADSYHYTTVIIDAGHGGEDGGTSGVNGILEKDVNLDIAKILRDMLCANGINVIMTREDDRLLYDRNANYKGRKKKLDLAARLAVTESTPDAIFVSIHMNSYPDPQYWGMQVFYSPNHSDSEVLADIMQRMNVNHLQPENKRQTKMATSAINLLYNAKCPAVLVECGFLSNPNDAELFRDNDYRQRVAFVLFCSITEFLKDKSSAD
jgi:N-acetylmuramoyl-L-alanine amidase